MSKFLILIIRAYQKHISPYKLSRGSCRFVPTCSNYFIDALKVHGFLKGTALGVYRILRCNPFCKGGYDPVPPKSKKTSKKGRT